MMHRIKHYVLWLFGACCLMVSCLPEQPVIVRPPPATPPTDIHPLLLQLEDFQWGDGYYAVEQTDFDPTPTLPMEHGWDVVLSPILHGQTPRLAAHPDKRKLGQSIFVYKDRATAQQAFEEVERDISILLWGPYNGNLDPRLENVMIGCDQYRTSDSNISQQCNLLMQQGRYMIQVYILIDEEATTMSHWDTCVALIQEKMIAQVEQESQP